MRRDQDRRRTFSPLLVIHDAAVLLAVFYAPIFWGGFGSSGLCMAATLVSVAALCAVVWRWGALNRGPAVIPNAVHLPALLFLSISALSALVSASHHSSNLELARITTGVLLLLLVGNRALMPAAPALPVMVIFASSLLVLPFVQTSGESGPWLDVFTGLAAICVCAFLIAHRRTPEPVRRWVEAVALSAGLAVALYGIREKILAHYALDNPTWQVFSTFFNPNELAGYLALMIPVALALLLAPQKLWSRLLLGFAACLLVVAIVPTNSTGAYLATAAALLGFGLLLSLAGRRAGRSLALLALVCMVIALAVVVAVKASPALGSRVGGAFDLQRASNMFRVLTWKGTLLMAAHHPWLGIGPAAFKSVYMNYAVVGYTEAAHQNYLQVLAEQGAFGGLAFLWLLSAMLFTGWRAMRRVGADRASQLVAVGGMCGVVAFLVHGLVDYGWYIGATNLALWFLAGVLAHLAHGRELAVVPTPARDDAPRGKRRRSGGAVAPPPPPADPVHAVPWPTGEALRALALLALAVVLCSCVWVGARNALAQAAMNRGDQAWTDAVDAQRQGDLTLTVSRYRESLNLYQAAVSFDPGWAVLHEKLGRNLRGKEGEQHLQQALALEPMSFAPYLSLAKLYDEEKRFPEAVKAYQESLQRFPQNTRALRLLAETYRGMGEEQKAFDTYRRLADLDDQPINRYRAVDIDVDANFAYAYYQLGRAELGRSPVARELRTTQEAALSWFQRVVAVVDEYFRPGGGYSLDQMFARVGKPRTNRAEELLPLKAKALWRMAEVYVTMGKPTEAAAKRAEALRVETSAATFQVTFPASLSHLLAEEDREVGK